MRLYANDADSNLHLYDHSDYWGDGDNDDGYGADDGDDDVIVDDDEDDDDNGVRIDLQNSDTSYALSSNHDEEQIPILKVTLGDTSYSASIVLLLDPVDL